MQEPSWIFILFIVTVALVGAAALFSYVRTSKNQDEGAKSKLGNG